MVGSWCALTFHSRKYHRSLDSPPLVAAKGHKAYSVLKQEWGPVHSHTIVQHCLLSSCTELPLKSIQDAYGTFLERDINQKYIHSRGVCVCMWASRFFLMAYCKYQALFPALGLGNQMWRQPESPSRVWKSWLCVYLQYTLWCMWNPPYTRVHTHTPESVFVHLCGYI